MVALASFVIAAPCLAIFLTTVLPLFAAACFLICFFIFFIDLACFLACFFCFLASFFICFFAFFLIFFAILIFALPCFFFSFAFFLAFFIAFFIPFTFLALLTTDSTSTLCLPTCFIFSLLVGLAAVFVFAFFAFFL